MLARQAAPFVLALGLALCAPVAWAPVAWAQQAAPSLLREEAVLELPGPAEAVAINADESMLAAASAEGRGRWRVDLFDRPSGGRLGALLAAVGDSPRLAFSPAAELLVVAGSTAIQLWSLPIAPLSPEKPLDEEHRRWVQRLDAPPGAVGFGTPPQHVYWSVGPAVFRRGVQPGVPFDGQPVWRPVVDAATVRAFAFDPDRPQVALVYESRKDIGLLDLNAPQAERNTTGHRFPVAAASIGGERSLLTLDAGHNLVTWQDGAQPLAARFLEKLPADFKPVGLHALGPRHLLLVGQDGLALALDERSGRPVGELHADGARQVAVSATARYVAVGEGRTLRLYGFARPFSPLEHVRRLRRLEAFELAQSYVRLLDERGLSPQLKADLQAEAGRQPPGLALQQALARLEQAEQEGDAERIRYWADQVLALQGQHPAAVTALRKLRERRDAQVLQQAREAIEAGQHRVAISLLSDQVQPDSRHYGEAAQLIREAEALRGVETTLMQAREKLNLGDTVAADALVHEALRRAPGNAAALALQSEIDGRTGASLQRMLAAPIGLGVAGLLVLALAWRYGRRLAPGAGSPPVTANGGARGRRAGVYARGGPYTVPEPEPPLRERPMPRPQAANAARRKVIEALIQETEALLNRTRLDDTHGRHTAQLMELEAELSAIARRTADPNAELGHLHTRLKAIQAQVQALHAAQGMDGGGARQRGADEPPPRGAKAGAQADGAGARASAAPPETNDDRTFYEVLELTSEATAEQIRTAYHRLLKQYHPDLHTASRFDWVRAESERMSRRISQAYQVLSDPGSRARYDRELREQRKGVR